MTHVERVLRGSGDDVTGSKVIIYLLEPLIDKRADVVLPALTSICEEDAAAAAPAARVQRSTPLSALWDRSRAPRP